MGHFLARLESHGGGIFPVHEHDQFEAVLVLSGRRIQHLTSHDVDAGEGALLFTAPGERHGATITGPTSILLVQFDVAFLHPELSAEAVRAWCSAATLAAAPELLPFAGRAHLRFRADACLVSRLREIWMDLVARSGSQSIGAAHYTRAQLSILMLEIAQAFEPQIIATAPLFGRDAVCERIAAVRRYIESNLAERISLEAAARQLALSASRLAATIKSATGKTFGELVADARLQHARELLLYTDQRVAQVASECGFEEHAYFSRRFRQEFGTSPQEYRRRRDSSLSRAPAPASR